MCIELLARECSSRTHPYRYKNTNHKQILMIIARELTAVKSKTKGRQRFLLSTRRRGETYRGLINSQRVTHRHVVEDLDMLSISLGMYYRGKNITMY